MASPTYAQERQKLLTYFEVNDDGHRSGNTEELRTTPLISLQVKDVANNSSTERESHPSSSELGSESSSSNSVNTTDSSGDDSRGAQDIFTQYTLLGLNVGEHDSIAKHEPILLNTRTPASTFICGSQGSGKSYTLSCMLENYINPSEDMGKSGPRMAGLVFHYDEDASSGVAEVAGLCSQDVRTMVLVPATNYSALRAKYEAIPGAEDNLQIMPLYFHGHHLTIDRMTKMMAFQDADGNVPLYLSVVFNILRKLALEAPGKPLNYKLFKSELASDTNFAKNQSSMLQMRLDLLESCLAPNKKSPDHFSRGKIEPGTLTIIDLSCPLVDKGSARVFFDVVLGLFKEHRPSSGLVVALDEAHKFMDDSAGVSGFTERLMTTIREQRHIATRVLIATQEPTISPKLLDLCSISIIHRFNSPAWLSAIEGHLGAAKLQKQHSAADKAGLMEQIMHLDVGESLVFAPSAYVCIEDGKPKKLQDGIMKMKTRKRLGQDQGLSKLADAVD